MTLHTHTDAYIRKWLWLYC